MKIDGCHFKVNIVVIIYKEIISNLGTNSARQKETGHQSKEWLYCQLGEALRIMFKPILRGIRLKNIPLPWTMLAGCGKVCIRKTAHKSTYAIGSLPSEGSRHKTNKSLHRMPTRGRGVNSGARQSTCTVDASPWALIASKDTTVFLTTRVRSKLPSMIKRLIR